jgi:hypothetical protein
MHPNEIHGKNVLIACLNWGMGHVSRSIGLIHQLINQNNVMHIACDAQQEVVFKEYFPDAHYVQLEGYPFEFRGKGNFTWDLIRSWSKLKIRLREEHNQADEFVKRLSIDLVLSDHRYGFYSHHAPSVFITHQYNLPVSGIHAIADHWHKKRLRPFSQIWVMDYSNSALAGKLSMTRSDTRAVHIGPYSRFSVYSNAIASESLDLVAIISGPLVYAQQFAKQVERDYPEAVIVCNNAIRLLNNAKRIEGTWKNKDAVIMSAKRIISRAGYSTVMDLVFLQKTGILIPTPGQFEQYHLHDWLTENSVFSPTTIRQVESE